MARKIKSDTRNIARRILALDAAYEGRIVKMLEAFENAADLVKRLAVADANERRAWQMYILLKFDITATRRLAKCD